jgi:beta-galactosidase
MDGWAFAWGEPKDFKPVALPHDWLISDPTGLYRDGDGWYRRALSCDCLAAGERALLCFDGVYMDSTLSVNGRKVGDWKYGYTAFSFDITDFLHPGVENELLLQVRYTAPNARWYTGAGIYREVELVIVPERHIVRDSVYITTRREGGAWQWEATAEAETGGLAHAFRHTLLGGDAPIESWDIDHPRLYTLRTELLVDDQVEDAVETRFGFRETAFTPDQGFFLNGRHVLLHGVCLHHDLGALGAAVYPDAIRRQLTKLRAMGVNAVRTAHNPPAKVFMDCCDEMGMLVLSELLDIWRHPKNAYDYARFFDEWHQRDVAAWVRRDRNCPSVILWSVGNEIGDTHTDPVGGRNTLNDLAALVRRHDPRGHAPVTLCSNYMAWENTQRCADDLKLIGYNYGEKLYAAHHAAHPDWVIFGGETGSTVQSRGVYHFPLAQSVLADDDLQCSALGNSSTSWGAKNIEACVRADQDAPYSLGQFLWAGQDYIGEPTPYHTKNCYFGHLDTAGFPKDSYYYYQAAWTDAKTRPMVHLFPHWDFSPGQPIDLRVVSNAPEVELFFEGQSLGRQPTAAGRIADYQMPYRPGTLRAVAYDAQGAPVAEAVRSSFGDTASLTVQTERWGELTFATIRAVDAEGNPVENANDRARVTVKNGTLLALDNGDATDWEPYQTDNKRLFSGQLLAIAKGDAPEIIAVLDGVDVPIRKVSLSAEGYHITAEIFPPHATHTELNWRLTDVHGIDSPLGRLAVAADGRSATIEPLADGEVYVRCGAMNGRPQPAGIALLPLTITGVGDCRLNPYEFIAGGLSSQGVGLTNGNERGVATQPDGGFAGFEGLDFGAWGADRLTLWLFPLRHEPFTFDIYEGMPGSGEKLLTARYDKGSIWNTYQAVSYQLPRRLSGVTAVSFVFGQKVHIKGFQFERSLKGFARLPAAAFSAAYGDDYTASAGRVEGIGNNVTLVYEDMDFGEAGAARMRLRYRSDRPQSPVHLLFARGEESLRALVTLPQSADYAEAVCPLGQRIAGAWRVSLLFLPGTALDLDWFAFEEEGDA